MESTTTYTTTETHDSKKAPASPATIALASIGFVTLIVLGILLAIYSAQYVPTAMNKFFSAIGTKKGGNPALNVVSTTTISFGQQPTATTGALMTATTTAPAATSVSSKPATVPATSAPHAPRLYGLPNLSVTILATGYLANGAPESFVASPIVPPGARAAVRFSIANTGTNLTGPWNFAAAIPTQNVYVFTSPVEQSLNPGDHIVFTLGFDQADFGPNHPITIIADPSNALPEGTKADNAATAIINVQ